MGLGGGGSSMMGGGGMVGGGKGTASLADSNVGSVVALDPTVRLDDYGGSSSFHGQIETVQAYGTTDLVAQILNQPGQNRVLVIDGGGARSDGAAAFDGVMASSASRNGWRGVIVHGYVRDVATLRQVNLGVKALGASPVKGNGGMVGQQGAAVGIGATQFQPGWWVYADADGILMSQVDVSGGSFGAGMTMGGGSYGAGYRGAAVSSMGSALTRGYGGGGAAYGAGGMTGGATASGLTGGYAPRSSMGALGTGGYGTSAVGGTGGASDGGHGGVGQKLMGGYGSAGVYGSGGMSSMSGGYDKGSSSNAGGYGGYGGYGSYSNKKRNKKVFKMLLATSIAAVVWLVCLQ